MLTLFVVVILLTTFSTLLLAEKQPVLNLPGTELSVSISTVGQIFYQDPDSKTLLIDFKEVDQPLARVLMSQEHRIFLDDLVSDLAVDSIYEIDLANYQPGEYMVQLLTKDAQKITKAITIE